jgi:hypothetical protein
MNSGLDSEAMSFSVAGWTIGVVGTFRAGSLAGRGRREYV